MNDHYYINQFKNGSVVSDYYIISEIRSCITKSGKPYLSAILSDASGTVPMVAWEYDGNLCSAQNGEIILVTGLITLYQEFPQLRAEQITLPLQESIGHDILAALVPSAPINVERTMSYVWNTAQSIKDPQIRDLCLAILGENWDSFTTIPAGKCVHHAFRHGLLMHTANMLFLADSLTSDQVATPINRDLLLCGVMLHDIGKLVEFDLSPSTGLVTGYSVAGNLLGHSYLGADMVASVAEQLGTNPQLSFLIQHMILSHHGDPDRGAAKRPLTIEAELVHALDMLDSRREIYSEALSSLEAGSFSKLIPALDHPIFYPEYGAPVKTGSSSKATHHRGEKSLLDSEDHYPINQDAVCTFPDGTQVTGEWDGDMFYPSDSRLSEF